MTAQSGNETVKNDLQFLKKLQNPHADAEFIERLYNHLVENSHLSRETIHYELEVGLTRLHLGRHFFLTLDVEEISFLILHNIYQEKDTGDVNGRYPDIDVAGKVNDRYLFLISETKSLIKKTGDTIQDMIREGEDSFFRFSSHAIISKPEAGDIRRLYILEEEKPGDALPFSFEKAVDFLKKELHQQNENAIEGDIADFVASCGEAFLAASIAGKEPRGLAGVFLSWRTFRDLHEKGEEVVISLRDHHDKSGTLIEKEFEIWMPREKFQENYITINQIFERRGIPFTFQKLETVRMGDGLYISLNTFIDAEHLSDDIVDFLRTELYNRIILLKSAPVSVGEIKSILDMIKTARDYVKLDLIEVMQKNKQKEYLIPLVLMLNDANTDIRFRAFGLIKHYLLNPTARMKNDYYWSTLSNIFSAATVPIEREKDRPSRPLTDEEIMQLISFRDIYYESYVEPLSKRGFLFIRMNGIGIGKGGIRQDASHVSFSGEGALSTNMLFKTLGVGIPKYATGKGGILGDVNFSLPEEEKRKRAWQNVFRGYADFLYYRSGTGPLSDVPAGDVGVGADEIGVIYEQITENAWKDICRIQKGDLSVNDREALILKENFGIDTGDAALVEKLAADRSLLEGYTASAITGKPGKRGLALRTGATGRGLVEVLAAQQNYQEYSDGSLWTDPARVEEAMAEDARYREKAFQRMKMLTFSVQGFGKVGASFAEILDAEGALFKMISDVSGTVVNEKGISNMHEFTERCRGGKFKLSDVPEDVLGESVFVEGDTIAPLQALTNVVVPCALEDVITTEEKPDERHIHVRDFDGDYLLQGANGPATSEAEEVLSEMGKVSFPDILANAGGVLASYLEWLNGMVRQFGYRYLYQNDFVNTVVHTLVASRYPDCLERDLYEIDETIYALAFRFILRGATVDTITLSRTYNISMRTAFMALGIRRAAEEGRLTSRFGMQMGKLRETFAEKSL